MPIVAYLSVPGAYLKKDTEDHRFVYEIISKSHFSWSLWSDMWSLCIDKRESALFWMRLHYMYSVNFVQPSLCVGIALNTDVCIGELKFGEFH